jgi:hypothetical protein
MQEIAQIATTTEIISGGIKWQYSISCFKNISMIFLCFPWKQPTALKCKSLFGEKSTKKPWDKLRNLKIALL